MRILFVCNDLVGGGAQKLICDLLPRIHSKDILCDLLVFSNKNDKYSNELKRSGINVYFAPKNASHIGRIRYLYGFIEKRKYDIIHAHLFPTIYYVAIIKILLKNKTKIIMTEHSTDNKRRHIKCLRLIERIIYSKYDRIIAISDKTKVALENWIGKKNNNIFVINNGVNISKFISSKPYDKADFDLNYSNELIYLGMIGSFTPQKNHKQMIEIFEKLPNNYRLVLAGEGALKNEIESTVSEKSKKGSDVIFLGFRYDIPEVMKTVDVIVIPSLWEGFGLIAIEAMASGKPVIAFNVPGLSETVGDAGILIEPNNLEGFKEAIIKLENKSTYEMLVKKGEERALKFDISKTVEGYINTYILITETLD